MKILNKNLHDCFGIKYDNLNQERKKIKETVRQQIQSTVSSMNTRRPEVRDITKLRQQAEVDRALRRMLSSRSCGFSCFIATKTSSGKNSKFCCSGTPVMTICPIAPPRWFPSFFSGIINSFFFFLSLFDQTFSPASHVYTSRP